jgi:hypothetical protein
MARRLLGAVANELTEMDHSQIAYALQARTRRQRVRDDHAAESGLVVNSTVTFGKRCSLKAKPFVFPSRGE